VIFNMSGGNENVKKYGDWFSYHGSPRAKIFKRDHSKVIDLKSMISLMRQVSFILVRTILYKGKLSCGENFCYICSLKLPTHL
jgi:hypothetical protein